MPACRPRDACHSPLAPPAPAQAVNGPPPPPATLAQILLNKAALSSFHFTATNSLLFFQCALCVVLVYASALAGWVEVEPLNWNIVRVWMPVNLLFTSMIGTGFYALQMMGVQMVSRGLLGRAGRGAGPPAVHAVLAPLLSPTTAAVASALPFPLEIAPACGLLHLGSWRVGPESATPAPRSWPRPG